MLSGAAASPALGEDDPQARGARSKRAARIARIIEEPLPEQYAVEGRLPGR